MTHSSDQGTEAGSPEPPDDEKHSMLAWVGWAVGLSVVSIAVLLVVFGALSGYGWWPWNNDPVKHGRPELFEVTRSAVAAGALVAAAVAGAITVRRQRSTERSVRISADAQRVAAEAQRISARTYELETQRQEAEVVSRLRDRYTTAAGQLGHESPAIRLAGAYALAALADEWLVRSELTARGEAQASVDLLCSYMRAPREVASEAEGAADLEVRQSIVRIITTHLQEGAHTSWVGMDLDFTEAVFAGRYRFDGAQFTGGKVSFTGAQFTSGIVSFHGAQFTDGTLSFRGAKFTDGTLSFRGAKFTDAEVSFAFAQFTGGFLSFHAAELTGGALTFDEAGFTSGRVSFTGVQFIDAEVSFHGAKFTEAEVSFAFAQFASDRVSFDGVQFTGGTTSFDCAKFTDGTVTFDWTQFTDGTVTFRETVFTDGTVTFRETVFTDGTVSGPWPEGTQPKRWPTPDQ